MASLGRAFWTRRGKGDDGAILPTAALALVALVAFAGLTLAGGSVYAAAQDGRKAADLAALGGAANLPTLNLGTTTFDPTSGASSTTGTSLNPLNLPDPTQADKPLATLDLTAALPTLDNDFASGVCAIAAREFGGGRAPIEDGYPAPGTVPTCTSSFGFENQWLQELANCLAGDVAAADCANRLDQGLYSLLPAPDAASIVVTKLSAALTKAGKKGQVVTKKLITDIQTLNATLPGAPLTPLLDYFNSKGGISIDMTKLAPAILTPQVTVEVQQQVQVPGANMLGHGPVTVTDDATARRVIKNAVVVPTVTPNVDGTFTIDVNPYITTARDTVLGALDQLAADIAPEADQALTPLACPNTTTGCPVVEDSFGQVTADVRDAVDPPNGPAPDAVTLINNAVASGQAVMVAIPSYQVDPQAILGSTVYNLPGVKDLLGNLDFIPAFDVVPAILSAGPIGQVLATPVYTAVTAAQTRGLYRARLID